MSYLSLISWTDRDVFWVATKMRSAYSSVSNRETSFSRIGLDSVVDSNPVIVPVLGFDTRGSGGRRRIAPTQCGSHDRSQDRPREPSGQVPREVEQLRVRLLSVEDDGAVDAVDPEDGVREVLELRGRRALRRHEPHEHVVGPADRGEDARHAFNDLFAVHGLQRIEGHEGEEGAFALRQLELHVGPLQVRLTLVPSMWRTVRETSAEPSVA